MTTLGEYVKNWSVLTLVSRMRSCMDFQTAWPMGEREGVSGHSASCLRDRISCTCQTPSHTHRKCAFFPLRRLPGDHSVVNLLNRHHCGPCPWPNCRLCTLFERQKELGWTLQETEV